MTKPIDMPKPPNPALVMAVAAVLTGMGQVMNGQANRGLMMAFTALSLAWVSYNLTTPEHSFVGRYAGGFMIHAIAFMDAYRVAKFRWQEWKTGQRHD
ncbi:MULTISPECIES: hypothetical protein [Roseovarius]|uniref:hypothetical protein n=1 Tax=Roseovarius TaxID=74030 RepID=UPI001C0B9297|nr:MULTISPECIES: hypothetical protein [Roseovarius]MBU3261713.1 hypothetical protein [Roseovarius sp. PS-C2]